MEQVVLEAVTREAAGKGAARQERARGSVPGVAYGHGLDAQALAVDERTLSTVLRHHRGSNVLLDLRVDGKAPKGLAAIIKSLQTDPLTDAILAVDFQWVSLTEKVTVNVTVHLDGVAEGVAEGGVLDQMLYEASVSCLPLEMPEALTLDVSEMVIGDTKHVSDLTAPDGVEILDEPETPVVTLRPPAVIAEPEPEEVLEGEEGEEAEGEAPEGEKVQAASTEGEAESGDDE